MIFGPRKGLVFIISAPSGCGKTTLTNRLLSVFPNHLFRSITCTTREPREGEIDGVDYHFLTRGEFEKKRWNKEFLEFAKNYDHYYGTLKKDVEELLKKGSVVLVIDVKGALAIQNEMDTVTIFISPPSKEELERRIRSRMQDQQEEIEKRLIEANVELEKSTLYDYNLVNDDIERALEVLKSIIIAESFRSRQNGETKTLLN